MSRHNDCPVFSYIADPPLNIDPRHPVACLHFNVQSYREMAKEPDCGDFARNVVLHAENWRINGRCGLIGYGGDVWIVTSLYDGILNYMLLLEPVDEAPQIFTSLQQLRDAATAEDPPEVIYLNLEQVNNNLPDQDDPLLRVLLSHVAELEDEDSDLGDGPIEFHNDLDPIPRVYDSVRWNGDILGLQRIHMTRIFDEDELSSNALATVANLTREVRDPPREVCPICQDPLDREPTVSVNTCNHHFHRACLMEWVATPATNRNRCPICRQEME